MYMLNLVSCAQQVLVAEMSPRYVIAPDAQKDVPSANRVYELAVKDMLTKRVMVAVNNLVRTAIAHRD